MSNTVYAYICECSPTCTDVVDSEWYDVLWRNCFGEDEFASLNPDFTHMRNIHYIIEKSHIHKIPKHIEILAQAGNLLLVKEL